MATRNDITGDALISKASTDSYRDNYDRIFGKKNKELVDDTFIDEGTTPAHDRIEEFGNH